MKVVTKITKLSGPGFRTTYYDVGGDPVVSVWGMDRAKVEKDAEHALGAHLRA